MFCEDLFHNTPLCISCMNRHRSPGHYNCDGCMNNHMNGRAVELFASIKNKMRGEVGEPGESWHIECWGVFGDLVLEFGLDT